MAPTDMSALSARLDAISLELARQNSYWHVLARGIFYGVGFIIGSVVLSAILIGIFSPLVKDIPGFSQAYQAGAGLINHHN